MVIYSNLSKPTCSSRVRAAALLRAPVLGSLFIPALTKGKSGNDVSVAGVLLVAARLSLRESEYSPEPTGLVHVLILEKGVCDDAIAHERL